jgi:hypothetical protein
MNNPASFETAWTEAEKAAFLHLCQKTGSEENKGAFIGKNPGVVNAWHFSGMPMKTGEEALLAPDLPSMAIPYYAECLFLKRDACQKWAMRIIGGLPLVNAADANIALLRVREIGEIQPDKIDVANEKDPMTVWALRITLDLVFATGGKANMSI